MDDVALAQIVSVVETFSESASWSFQPDVSDCREILAGNHNNVESAVAWLYDLRDAEEGLVEALSSPTLVGGAENGGNSCYMDSLLFAMFATTELFDGLLRFVLDPGQLSLRRFQSSLRLFVNQMRRGVLISKFTANRLRDDAFAAGFAGVNGMSSGERTAQEDTTEFFLWLLNALGAPYLPLNQSIIHGGERADADDTKYSAERFIALDIPSDDAPATSSGPLRPIPLEKLLERYFFEQHISVTRDVAIAHPQEDFNDEKKRQKITTTELRIPALSSLKLLPFYTPQAQTGDRTLASSALWQEPATPVDGSPPSYSAVAAQQRPQSGPSLVLPIVIKRYAGMPTPPYSKRLAVPVAIPGTLRFSLFVDDLRGQEGDYVLELISAVCHRGESTSSGHYVAAAKRLREDGATTWLHFDDMASPSRVTKTSNYADELRLFDELSRDSYLLFFQLKRETHSLQSAADQRIATQMQQFEMEKGKRKSTANDCAMQ